MQKKIAILGSTGSIGTQTLDVVRANPAELEVIALAAGTSTDLMEKQIREFHPAVAAMYDETAAADLRSRVSDLPVRILSGMEGLLEMASMEGYDTLVTAIVGMIGIRPTIAAIESGKDIALANKETLVCAGHIIMPLAREKGVRILPVDSEHSAIFQSLQGGDHAALAGTESGVPTGISKSRISRVLLTASGGPFRGMTRDQLADKKAEDALKHPNWNMGRKITIDSATLVNKGLEVMEAGWLFDVPLDRITVLVHPQSILHSAVEFVDGAVIGQMGTPDMKLPIEYALFYPDRRPMDTPKLDLFAVQSLTFEKPDPDTFEGLKLALRAGQEGGSMPTVFNAANELAVADFLDHRIGFLEIYERIERSMERHHRIENPTVAQILAAEEEVKSLWQA